MAPPLTLWYLYDEPLPNRYAASIQILGTARAFASGGDRFVFLSGRLSGDQDAILGHYGLAAGDGLSLRPFFPSRRLPTRLRAGLTGLRLRRLAAGLAREPGRHVLMSRGTTGIAVLPRLRRALPSRSAVRLVLEMHGLSFLRAAERAAGRSLAPGELPPSAGAARERERAALAAADAAVYLTPEVEAAARAELGATCRALVLPSGTTLPPADVTPAVATGIARYDVAYAGKIEARKGIDLLCAAMRHLPECSLAIAGGPEPAAAALRSRLEADGLAGRVTVAGLLPPAAVADFLRAARVGVCPMSVGVDTVADRFTSPMKLLQMMALGLPVVATDVPPVRAVATHERDALLVPPDAPEAMAAAIDRLLRDPDLAARLGAQARRTAGRFSWNARAAALRSFLDALD
jgi:glycosyltransferase involved in cell wall biosynthesis